MLDVKTYFERHFSADTYIQIKRSVLYMKKSEVKRLFLSRGKVAEDIKETYFLTSVPQNSIRNNNCFNSLQVLP